MKFVIITHTKHISKDGKFFAYAPYVREMNLWAKYVTEILIVAPTSSMEPSSIHLAYNHPNVKLTSIPSISLTSFSECLKTLYRLPAIKWKIFKSFRQADHIHLRCPGNIGLLGVVIQIFFPKKLKTAKYAGNWDPMAKQPLSYRFQKWLLANTLLTKNMQVLVYGNWTNQSKNVKSFFTATYPKERKVKIGGRNFISPFRFIFVGSLAAGKRPLYSVKLIEALRQKGIKCTLEMYGEGSERAVIENYIIDHQLVDVIKLFGNQTSEIVEEAYKQAHFLILPSKSEGWPKVVAEAMFLGAIPIVTSISCVPWMLGEGERGILIEGDLETDIAKITNIVNHPERLVEMSLKAQRWSQNYTLDTFETEIAKLLIK